MVLTTDLQEIATALPIFSDPEQKERFLFILGALSARVISLRKAAEVMNLEQGFLIQIHDLLGIEFSYLAEEDIELERAKI
ncbi:MAG: hypothetical protein HC825_08585 [Oscillatoriales cyanobacterium RM1_1_9]|nr:hypothetical protein [Oscillatoriales cyanobacterium SM2_3_0]NJO47508.1 hypothetical protein [Oscillatoriales cyanobacterium RM2_1_1]NJO71713.1 hypothetical protein [Oscillatoriales cyanobacterium RM1_1_9]